MEPETETKKICGAKTRGTGNPCRKPPIKGRKRCRLHGGLSPAGGPGHHSYKHGNFSRYTTKVSTGRAQRLRSIIESDEDYLNLRPEIALVTYRLEELWDGLETADAKKLWQDLNAVTTKIAEDTESRNFNNMPNLIRQLSQLVNAGVKDSQKWEEIDKWLERKRSMVATDTKRIVMAEEMMDKDKAVALLSMMETAINESLNNVLSQVNGGDALITAVLQNFTTYLRRNILTDGRD